ncbi:MAG: hypothetical protein ACFFCS_21025 [Candidatus Hodarchaeota archaeon]
METERNVKGSFLMFFSRFKYLTIYDIARLGIIIWAGYYFTTIFMADVILLYHGLSFWYLSFYWLANGFLLVITILYAWKPKNYLSQVAMVPVFVYSGYSMVGFFNEKYVVLNFPTVIWHGVLIGFMVLNAVLILKSLFGYLFSERFIKKFSVNSSRKFYILFIVSMAIIALNVILMVSNIANQYPLIFLGFFLSCFCVFILGLAIKHNTRKMKVIVFCTYMWLGLTCWSYVGFSQEYKVVDPGQDEFSVSFWSITPEMYNASYYSTADGITEMQKFQQLNSSFYISIDLNFLGSSPIKSNFELVFSEWVPYNVSFIFDITPLYEDTVISSADFVTYYYLESINETVRELMDWLEPLNFTNFRGISFDIEPPNGGTIRTISRDQYQRALESYDGILAEFKSRFPNCTTQLIQMEQIIFDFYDGDHDLDVAQLTVSTEMENWDWKGFMTYQVYPSPTTTSYRYAFYLENMVEQFGVEYAQPWIGWWYEPGDIDLPGVYETSLEHVKIAKSMGVREAVLAPTINFIGYNGSNQSMDLQRLDDLISIKNGFEPFSIPILQNQRLYKDFNLYFDRSSASYVIAGSDVVMDLLLGTPGYWFAWVQALVSAMILSGALLIFKKKH